MLHTMSYHSYRYYIIQILYGLIQEFATSISVGFGPIYLAAPLHAQAWTEVQTRLSLRLQSHLMGPLYRDAMEMLARAERQPWQAGHPLHNRLQSLRQMVRRRLTGGRLYRQCAASRGPPPT